MVMDADRLPPAGDWRQGAAVAVLSFDVDAEAPILAEGDRYAEDLSTMSHQAYGPRVGVPRILELLAAHEIKATFFVPGVTAERWLARSRYRPADREPAQSRRALDSRAGRDAQYWIPMRPDVSPIPERSTFPRNGDSGIHRVCAKSWGRPPLPG